MMLMIKLLVQMVILSCSLTSSFSVTSSLSFNYTSLDANSENLTFKGSATRSDSGLQITKNQIGANLNGSTGRAIYKNPLHLWDKASGNVADFTTQFSFVIDSQGKPLNEYADGMAFFLAHKDLPFTKYISGSSLGLLKETEAETNSTAYPFLAVEFDTYQNVQYNDPPHEHVGININSMNSSVVKVWNSSIPFGFTNVASISYSSSTNILNVTFTGYRIDNNASFIQNLNYEVNLSSFLPEWVQVGFSASTGDLYELHTINSWSFNSNLIIDDTYPPASPPSPPINNEGVSGGNKIMLKLAIGLTVGFGCALVIVGVFFIWFMRSWKKDRNEDDFASHLSIEFEQTAGPKRFSYDALAQATNNFAEEEKLGQGGFGGVYKGFIAELDCNVAVKKISSESKQGIKEYTAEVKIISRLRHKNLVQLVGWCHEKGKFLLVYELMDNGSLDHHLFRSKNKLSWSLRYKIARGLASALFYLHEEWEQTVLHRDIKTSNVMLDSDFNAKLGDFGLAKLVDHGKGSATTVLAGTFGYMAPECLSTSKATTESDVYSFGIVCLEIACGRKPIDPHTAEESQIRLVDWVWNLYGEGKILQAMDPRLAGLEYDEMEVVRLMILGLWCAHPDYQLRPTMRQAIALLSIESPLPNLPSKIPVPTYTSLPFFNRVYDTAGSSSTQVTGSTEFSSTQFSTTSSENYSSTAVLLPRPH